MLFSMVAKHIFKEIHDLEIIKTLIQNYYNADWAYGDVPFLK